MTTVRRGCVPLLCVMLCSGPGAATALAAAETAVSDFTSGSSVWQPRAPSVAVERVSVAGPGGTQTTALRISGRIEGGWNYAASAPLAVAAGKLYRLSAWVRVDRVGPGTPMPYLKGEFPAADRKRPAVQVRTDTCDAGQLRKWQRLSAEFRAPEEARTCWVALEKGTQGPTEIEACLAQVRLESISRFSVLETYRLNPTPPDLEQFRGIHPRLYLTADWIARLRREIHTTHAGIWTKIRQQADAAVRHGPPAYIREDSHSGAEQLWQRSVGNTLPLLATAYVLTREKPYLAAAQKWSLASCGYPTWGLGRLDGMDLAAGHQLFGLALVYDWCYRDLDLAARRQIRQTLIKRTAALFEAVASGKTGSHRSYLQNHLWIAITGMAAAGLALFDETDDAACWIGLPLEKYGRTMAALGPDGASHEGVGYWQYGAEYMLKFMHLARTDLGVTLYDRPWWRNTAAYAQYLALPRRAWQRDNCIVDLADCPRGNWYGPDYILRGLARLFRDGHAQWLAQQIDEAGVASPEAAWLNLLWYDPAVAPMSPAALPTLRHFDDLGIVSARSGWSGDESLLVFKCGPFIGHDAMDKFSYDPGGGHVHPDANHFVLFGDGQWLVRDDGYQSKATAQHNTLLVDGRGQLGEGGQWFKGAEPLAQKAHPRIIEADSTPALDRITGDATEAYPRELGLRRFVRHLLFVKPDVLIVADDVRLDKSARLELRFHPEQPMEQAGSSFLMHGRQAVLRLEPLTLEGVSISLQRIHMSGHQSSKGAEMSEVRLSAERSHWQSAVALSWAPAGKEPPRVHLQTGERQWTFSVRGRTLALDWDTARK